MAIVLGEPKVRGNSDVVYSKELSGGTAIPAGVAMLVHTDDKFKAAGVGTVPYCVSGKTTYSTIEGIVSGLEVGVRVAAGVTPVIGSGVTIKDADMSFDIATGAGYTAINAVWSSLKDTEAIDPNTGLAIANQAAATISFAGGL